MLTLKKISSICLLLLTYVGFGQSVVDDSTVTNISFEQSKYFTKQDVYVGDTILRSVQEGDRFDFFQYSFRDSSLLQDLGAYGSAATSMYVPYNKNLGHYDGVSSFDYLTYKDENVKYYDTKTPYSFLSYRQRFGGVQWANGGYTQSAGKVANFGTEVKRFNTPLNLGANPNNNSYADHFSLVVHASFIAPSKLYKALVNYRFMKQTVVDNGGIKFDNDSVDTDSIIVEDFVTKNLTNAFAQDKRNEWSLYQELSPFKDGQIKLYHNLNRTKKVTNFEDKNLSVNKAYYQNYDTSDVAIKDSNVYRVIENQVGINGRINQISYAGYLKNRLWKYEADTNLWDTASVLINRKSDTYIGGDLFYQTKARDVNARLNLEIGFDGTRKFDFVSDFKFLKIRYLDLKNHATLRQQNLSGNYYNWSNKFDPYVMSDLRIEPYYKGKKFYVSAYWSKQYYDRYVYYREDLLPFQDTVAVEGQMFGFNGYVNLKKWKLGQFIQVSNVEDIKFMAVPKFYTHTNLNYRFSLKKLKSLKMIVGADVYYFSKYKPLSYRSDLQSFVVQDKFEEPGYVILDTYVNIKYKTVDFSLKGINLLQGLGNNNGYYPTPGYYGRKRGVEIGLKWSFFG